MTKDFAEKIDGMIEEMNIELKRVRKARVNSTHHSDYVSSKINEIIRKEASSNPNDPVRSLGLALSRVGTLIGESFDNIDNIEKNIVVTINAYARVKDVFVSHTFELKQLESIPVSNSEKKDTDSKRPREIGTKPIDKLSKRRKKTQEKTGEKKTTTRKKKSKNT